MGVDLSEFLDELTCKQFLVDETSINTYDEIVYLFKLAQLKELAKVCHVGGANQTTRAELIRSILSHFKSQKSISFSQLNSSNKDKDRRLRSQQVVRDESSSPPKSQHFMGQCKKILGKCWKLEKEARNVFGRILALYSLSSTYNSDPNKKESGQQQL